jgi:Family of unknown function (DUF5519)
MRRGMAMSVAGAGERIDAAVRGWEGIAARGHRFGGTEYKLGRREIGHVHGDSLVDIPFPKRVRDELVTAGRAEAHHILPESGWVSIHLRRAADVENAIELMRMSFEIAERSAAAGDRGAAGGKDDRGPGEQA